MQLTAMKRRTFLRLFAAVSAAALHRPLSFAETEWDPSVRLTLRPDRLANKIGDDFTGLSYRSALPGNPHLFSGENTQLAGFIRRLSASGVLRIGGNSSEYCHWTPDPAKHASVRNHLQNKLPNNAPNLENMHTGEKANPVGFGLAVGPETAHKAPAPVSITPDAIRPLREFLDACGWKLIIGLNMGTGSAEDTADEAARVMDAAGSKLIAFQLCQEPDFSFATEFARPITI